MLATIIVHLAKQLGLIIKQVLKENKNQEYVSGHEILGMQAAKSCLHKAVHSS